MTGPGLQKINGQHLERLAVVYLRQSSARQVRENFRSTERQYGLAEEAVKLGWERERGELRFPLPVGLVYDADGRTIIDPDEEVQAAIADVFKAFWQTGSAYGVVGAFAGRRFPRRAYGGAWAGELRWGRLTHARVRGILRNPVYAGAYVFGRRRTRQLVHPDGSVHSSVTELPRDQWEVLIPDHHPGYI